MKSTNSQKRWHYVFMVLIPFIVPITIVEVYLRSDGQLSTYSEKTGNSYNSYYNKEPTSFYWNYTKNAECLIDQKEFKFLYKTNELGLREKKNAVVVQDTTSYRILTLGDSFTEGVGAPSDSTWPKVLESSQIKIKFAEEKSVTVYNAGMSGSDPFFNYRMLKDKLLGFQPNLIIQSINTSDLSDYLFRGGMDRFREDKVVFRNGPWWEILYRLSHTFRLYSHTVLGYNYTLTTSESKSKLYDMAILEYFDLFAKDYCQLSNEFGFSIIYLIQPTPADIKFVGNDEYKRLIKLDSLLNERGLQSLEILEPMKKRVGEDRRCHYSWKVDGHYNSNGYWELGNVIANSLNQLDSASTDMDLTCR